MASNVDNFYLRYYVGHKGKFGHEFLEFEFRPDGEYYMLIFDSAVRRCGCAQPANTHIKFFFFIFSYSDCNRSLRKLEANTFLHKLLKTILHRRSFRKFHQ